MADIDIARENELNEYLRSLDDEENEEDEYGYDAQFEYDQDE